MVSTRAAAKATETRSSSTATSKASSMSGARKVSKAAPNKTIAKAVKRATAIATKNRTSAGSAPDMATVVIATVESTAATETTTTASAVKSIDTSIRSKRTRDSQGRAPLRRGKQDYTRTITIFAGTGRRMEEFTVHEDRICKLSPYFNAACSKEWLEGQTGTFRLPLHPAKYFRLYIEWVYTGRIDLEELKKGLRENNLAADEEYDHGLDWTNVPRFAHFYCNLWILADYLGDTACQRACIVKLTDQVCNIESAFLWSSTVESVAEKTSADSGLYRWMIDSLAQFLVNPTEDADALSRWIDRLPVAVKDTLLKRGFAKLKLETTQKLSKSPAFGRAGMDVGDYVD